MINQLIGKKILPSKTDGDPRYVISKGCTRYPVKCTFTKENLYTVETIKIIEINKKQSLSSKNFEKDQQVQDYIFGLNKNDSDFDYIIVNVPEIVLKDHDLSFISCIDFLDMIGIPDEELKDIADKRNLCIISHEGLDAAFFYKKGNDRGRIYPKDFIDLSKSNIFKHFLVHTAVC